MRTLEQIVDSLHASETLAWRSRYLVYAAIGLWLFLSAVALATNSAGFFSRSGAVGTGLVLVTFAFAAAARQSYHTLLLKGLVLVMRDNLRDHEGRPLGRAGGAVEDHDTAARDYDHNLEVIGRLFARLDRRSLPARFTEVGVAALSTLQWGYGDLFVNRALLCGEWYC